MKTLTSLSVAAIAMISPAAGDVKFSERLSQIADHLGEGGAHFSVTDSKGDLQAMGELIDRVLEVIPDTEEIPEDLSVDALFEDLGLYAVEGRGMSSHQHEEGGLWHNRSFVLTNGTHEGVLSLLGDEAREPVAHEFAPAGADLVVETSLNLREVERTAKKISAAFGEESEQQLGMILKEEATSLGLSLAEIFTDFTVHGTLVLWFDQEKKVELGPELMVPTPHFAARLDNAEIVWKLLKAELADDSEIVEKDGDVILKPKDGDADVESPFGLLQPHFVWSAAEKRLYFSVRDADLTVCRGQGERLSADAEYQTATKGLPAKTSSMAYASREALALIVDAAKSLTGEVPPEAKGVVDAILPALSEFAGRGGFAGAVAVEEDGFLFAANVPMPIKGESSMTGLSGVFTVATLAGMATPLILKAQAAGDAASDLAKMKSLASAQVLFNVDQGKFAGSLEELLAAGLIDGELVDELDQAGVVFLGKPKTLPSGEKAFAFLMSRNREATVSLALTNGAARKMDSVEFKRILGAQ